MKHKWFRFLLPALLILLLLAAVFGVPYAAVKVLEHSYGHVVTVERMAEE